MLFNIEAIHGTVLSLPFFSTLSFFLSYFFRAGRQACCHKGRVRYPSRMVLNLFFTVFSSTSQGNDCLLMP